MSRALDHVSPAGRSDIMRAKPAAALRQETYLGLALSNTAVVAGPAGRMSQQEALSRAALLGMTLFVLATWLLEHPYQGLVHDSIVYALMALARLHPDSLSHDIFLRFGSQDQYTIFGPVFGTAVRLLDLEPAAAWLTLVSQCAFFGCAWLLVRQFARGSLALLATGLLIALPSAYGNGDYFHYTESFLTPRLPAEALVLAAIAAMLARQRVWAALGILGALLLHPIMGAAGVAMFVFTFVAIPRPRLALGCGAGLLAISLAAWLWNVPLFVSFGPADSQWLQVVRTTSPYLFLTGWSVADWARVAVLMAVLWVGLLTATTQSLRNICGGALLTGVGGLALTALYCDGLHIVLVIAAQPWRWLWLTQVIAILLVPLIARNCLQAGGTVRAAIVLLAAAWLVHDDLAKFSAAALALVCVAARDTAAAKQYARLIFAGSCGMLCLAIALVVSDCYLFATTVEAAGASIGARIIRWLQVSDNEGLVPGAALVLTWWGFERSGTFTRTACLTMAGALACALLAAPSWNAWTASFYTPALRAAFGTWRNEIPGRAEVLWPGNPVGAWYLLERPSYWSFYQAVGAVFSKPKALELNRRTLSLGPIVDAAPVEPNTVSAPTQMSGSRVAGTPLNIIVRDTHGLQVACRNPDLAYVVNWRRVGATLVEPVQIDPHDASKRMYLYRCADFRGSP